MSSLDIGISSIAVVLVLLAFRIPIGVVLGIVSFFGLALVRGLDVAWGAMKSIPFDFSAHWSLSSIPMFLLMGAIAYHSGISAAIFQAARVWLSNLPGGLAVATNIACAGFAAASGSSVATAAAMGRIAIPEMLKNGYDKGLATGVVASGGTLGALIPPSILFVLYGIFAEVSISKLLIAGVLPGVLTGAVYSTMIIARCWLKPELGPRVASDVSWKERVQALGAVWPLALLIIGVIGGLYGGIFGPTEAGAGGAFFAFVIALLQRRLNLKLCATIVLEATNTTSRLFFVAFGAVLYTKFLAIAGVSTFLAGLFQELAVDPLTLILLTSLIFFVLGMFLDPIGLMLITLPILLPVFEAMDLSLIWLGVIVVKFVEIGMLTPPVGFNVYVIKSVVGDTISLEQIFRGVAWFLVCEVFIMILLFSFPAISLMLPEAM